MFYYGELENFILVDFKDRRGAGVPYRWTSCGFE